MLYVASFVLACTCNKRKGCSCRPPGREMNHLTAWRALLTVRTARARSPCTARTSCTLARSRGPSATLLLRAPGARCGRTALAPRRACRCTAATPRHICSSVRQWADCGAQGRPPKKAVTQVAADVCGGGRPSGAWRLRARASSPSPAPLGKEGDLYARPCWHALRHALRHCVGLPGVLVLPSVLGPQTALRPGVCHGPGWQACCDKAADVAALRRVQLRRRRGRSAVQQRRPRPRAARCPLRRAHGPRRASVPALHGSCKRRWGIARLQCTPVPLCAVLPSVAKHFAAPAQPCTGSGLAQPPYPQRPQ